MYKETVIYIYKKILFSLKKEKVNVAFCDNMNRPGGH